MGVKIPLLQSECIKPDQLKQLLRSELGSDPKIDLIVFVNKKYILNEVLEQFKIQNGCQVISFVNPNFKTKDNQIEN